MIYLFLLTEMEENIIFKINQIVFLIFVFKSIKMQKMKMDNKFECLETYHIKGSEKYQLGKFFKQKIEKWLKMAKNMPRNIIENKKIRSPNI